MSLYEAQRLPSHWNIIPALKRTNGWIPQRWTNCWVVEVGEPDVCHYWQKLLWPWAIYFLSYIPSGEPLLCCSQEKELKKEKLLQNKPSRSNPNKYGGKGGEGKESTQFLPSLWAILRSPKGQDLIRTVISVQVLWELLRAILVNVFSLLPSEEEKLTSALQLQNQKGSPWSSSSQAGHRISPRNQRLILKENTKDFFTMNSSWVQINCYNMLLCLWLAFYCEVEFS